MLADETQQHDFYTFLCSVDSKRENQVLKYLKASTEKTVDSL